MCSSVLLLLRIVVLLRADTASEHRMFERLMVEDLVHWARDYKVRQAGHTC